MVKLFAIYISTKPKQSFTCIKEKFTLKLILLSKIYIPICRNRLAYFWTVCGIFLVFVYGKPLAALQHFCMILSLSQLSFSFPLSV